MVDIVNQPPKGNSPWPRRLRASVATLRGRSLPDPSSTRTGRFVSGLVFGLVGGLALLTAGALLPRAIGYMPLVVVSGSMEPTLHAGDIAITKKVTVDQVSLGDVVTYRSEPGLVTHRIVGLDLTPQGAFYQMKGDANGSRDPWSVSFDQIETKVLYRIPMVGYLVTFIDSPLGVLLMVVAPLTMLAMWWGRGKGASYRWKTIGSWMKRLRVQGKPKPVAAQEVIEEVGSSKVRTHAVRTRDHAEEVFHVIPRNPEQEYAE